MITKQRAWTRDNRMVTNVSTFYDDLDGELLLAAATHSKPLGGFEKEYIHFPKVIMKWSGLKDIKNIEIYEGDIVRLGGLSDKEGTIGVVEYGEIPFFAGDGEEIEDFYIGFCITTRNTGRDTIINKNKITIPLNSIWVDKLEIEIIGNELENPELIH